MKTNRKKNKTNIDRIILKKSIPKSNKFAKFWKCLQEIGLKNNKNLENYFKFCIKHSQNSQIKKIKKLK